MITIRQIKISIEKDTLEELKKKICTVLRCKENVIKEMIISKKSIDARHKPEIYYIYEVNVSIENEDNFLKGNKNKDIVKYEKKEYIVPISGNVKLESSPIIIGSGPAGLFCAYILSECGYKPIVIERGEKIENRIKTVENFWKTGKLNTNSNVQFGEGGAGTFSDGKLNTNVKDKSGRQKKVLETFVRCGVDKDILYIHNPHIGTDILRTVIKNMREKIIEMGGQFYYNSTLTNIEIINDKISSIEINYKEKIKTDTLILAVGHSARDTFKMMYEKNIPMDSKPFAVGLRVQHPQEMINETQYGRKNASLGAANYKLTYKAKNGRGVYSFCMCPGGFVVNASSEEKKLVINGMSNHKRDEENANSAIVVTIGPKDYGQNVLDGIEFQKRLEEKAYEIGDGKIPIQLWKDFKENKKSLQIGKIKPIFKGKYQLSNLNDLLPEELNQSIKEAILYFGTKIKGFDREDAILAGIESRTSSPIRIKRNEEFESDIKGIYPCGEGAGYAGGIMTAAVDGIKVAESIIKKYYV